MDWSLIDRRYPFKSFSDFVLGGYFLEGEARHLLIAWLGVLIFTTFYILTSRMRQYEVLAVLSVAFLPYSNPAFEVIGISIADLFAALSIVFYLLGFFMRPGSNTRLPLDWIAFWVLIALHSLLVFTFYDLGSDDLLKQRLSLVVRPLISLVAAVIVYSAFQSDKNKKRSIILALSFSALLSAVVYIVQMTSFSVEHIPYGTMPSAGFGGSLRFGGVSNEAGHLAKLTFPLLILLILTGSHKSRWLIFAFCSLIYLFNVSATGYVAYGILMTSVCILVLWRLLRKINIRSKIFVALTLLSIGIFALQMKNSLRFAPVYLGLVYKIEDAVNLASHPEKDIYGRSPLIPLAIIERYPLGIGYAGSSQRNIVMPNFNFLAKENNLGLNVALASWSYFLWAIGFYLIYKLALSWRRASLLQRSALVSLIALMAVDVLWASSGMYFALLLVSNRLGKNSCR